MKEALNSLPFFLERVDPNAVQVGEFAPLAVILRNHSKNRVYYLNWTEVPWFAFGRDYPSYVPANSKTKAGLSIEKNELVHAIKLAEKQPVFIVVAINSKKNVYDFWGLGAEAWRDHCVVNTHHHSRRLNATISMAHLVRMERFFDE